jgi:nucleotide-binding universal stress UspA family protein
MYTRILVPLDGSSLSELALPNAEEMARLTGAPLSLVYVVDLNRLDHFGMEELVGSDGLADQLQVAERAATTYLTAIAHTLEGKGLRTTIHTRCGDPTRELVAATQPGDLIIMATHGRGGVTRTLLGSVAESVARRSLVPVLLVRAATEVAPSDTDAITNLLNQDRYQPAELAQLLRMDVAQVRQAALNGQLPAQILDHHVISITRADALGWLGERRVLP